MSAASVWRDILSIAGFEVRRAVRTWRAVALLLMLLIANVGSAWVFVQGLGQMEQKAARTMGVATTSRPGALLDHLRQTPSFQELLSVLTGSPETAIQVADQPVLALFQLWIGMVFLPFFAATTASESVAEDVRSGAIRFEALRTGRGELVFGRMLGQLVLIGGALCLSLVGVWGVGMTAMAGQSAWGLAWGLVVWGGRAGVLTFAFVGLGMGCSQWTASPMWARVLALGLTASSWVAYGVVHWVESAPWTYGADAVAPLLPQTWMGGLWRAGLPLGSSVLALLALGFLGVGLGFVRFAGRDL